MKLLTVKEANEIVLEKIGNRNRFRSTEFELKKVSDVFLVIQILLLSGSKSAKYFIDYSSIRCTYVTLRNETYRVPTFNINKRNYI